MSDAEGSSDFLRRVSLSPVAINNRELLAGRRWTLLQAVAWISTQDQALVDEVGRWCPPNNALPHQNSSHGAALELMDRLQSLPAPALSFEVGQMHLLRLLNAGCIMAYVNHTATLLTNCGITGFQYRSDYVGLLPEIDKRTWIYVVVGAESTQIAWAKDEASPASLSRSAPRLSSEKLNASGVVYDHPGEVKSVIWTEEQMTEAIQEWANSSGNRDRDGAWTNHFKALGSAHGWDNRSFRAHWSKALDSSGKPGRPKSAQ